jgi:hypothetical protein
VEELDEYLLTSMHSRRIKSSTNKSAIESEMSISSSDERMTPVEDDDDADEDDGEDIMCKRGYCY